MVLTSGLPGQSRCRSCGGELNPHEVAAGGLCPAPACQAARVRDAARHVENRDRHHRVGALRATIEDHAPEIRAAADELGGDPDRTAYGVVPRQDRPLGPLPTARRAAFAAWLDEIVATAFTEPPPTAATADREIDEQPEHPLLVAACATCAGACCTLGGPAHAYLTADSIQLFRSRHPAVTPEQVTAHYLGRVPLLSIEDSCVYHGEHGCALSRDERADTCNRFHCGEQLQLQRRFGELDADRALIVAVAVESTPALGLYESVNGWRRPSSNPVEPGSEAARRRSRAVAGHGADGSAVAGVLTALMSLGS